MPLVQVKELLGHSCIRSTMTYVHVENNMQKVESPLDIFLEKENNRITKNNKKVWRGYFLSKLCKKVII